MLPSKVKRIGRLLDYLLPIAPVVLPLRHESGLINIPESMLLLGRNGLRKLIQPICMKRKILKGLIGAVEQKKIFHLWFHPSNFSYDTDTQFEILETVLKEVSRLKKEKRIEVLTMNESGERII